MQVWLEGKLAAGHSVVQLCAAAGAALDESAFWSGPTGNHEGRQCSAGFVSVCREGEHLPAMLALLAEPRSELASLLAGLLYSLVALGSTDFNHVSLLTGSCSALLCSIGWLALSAALTGSLRRHISSDPPAVQWGTGLPCRCLQQLSATLPAGRQLSAERYHNSLNCGCSCSKLLQANSHTAPCRAVSTGLRQ